MTEIHLKKYGLTLQQIFAPPHFPIQYIYELIVREQALQIKYKFDDDDDDDDDDDEFFGGKDLSEESKLIFTPSAINVRYRL